MRIIRTSCADGDVCVHITPAEFDHVRAVMAHCPSYGRLSVHAAEGVKAFMTCLNGMTLCENGIEETVSQSMFHALCAVNALPTQHARHFMTAGHWSQLFNTDPVTDTVTEGNVSRVLRLNIHHLTGSTAEWLRLTPEERDNPRLTAVPSGLPDGVLVPSGLKTIESDPSMPDDLRLCARKALEAGCSMLEFDPSVPTLSGLEEYEHARDQYESAGKLRAAAKSKAGAAGSVSLKDYD